MRARRLRCSAHDGESFALDGIAGDTASVQKAIDAAAAESGDAIAYLPAGNYAITNTLHVIGTNFFVGGSVVVEGKDGARHGLLGFQTRLATIVTHGLYLREADLRLNHPEHPQP